MDLDPNKRVLLRRIGVVIIGCFLILIGFMIYRYLQNPYGKQLSISNLSTYTAGKPTDTDRVNFIKHNLYTTVGYNVKTKLGNDSIKDVVIRSRSFSQVYDKSTGLYTVHFIVDIKSLKQSYSVSYQWSPKDRYNQNLSEYGTIVSCLPLKDLIYGDFECKDGRTLESGEKNYDPVAKIIPYHVNLRFEVNGYKSDGDNTVLYVDAYAQADEVSVNDNELVEYSKEIKAWLKENDLNPSRYTIDYNY